MKFRSRITTLAKHTLISIGIVVALYPVLETWVLIILNAAVGIGSAPFAIVFCYYSGIPPIRLCAVPSYTIWYAGLYNTIVAAPLRLFVIVEAYAHYVFYCFEIVALAWANITVYRRNATRLVRLEITGIQYPVPVSAERDAQLRKEYPFTMPYPFDPFNKPIGIEEESS